MHPLQQPLVRNGPFTVFSFRVEAALVRTLLGAMGGACCGGEVPGLAGNRDDTVAALHGGGQSVAQPSQLFFAFQEIHAVTRLPPNLPTTRRRPELKARTQDSSGMGGIWAN